MLCLSRDERPPADECHNINERRLLCIFQEAIEYLFPSGIYDKLARPVLKPPEQIFPEQKAAQFDTSGRPFHTMFYTAYPHLYKTLFVRQID